MAEAILSNLAQNLIETLASEALQATASIWGFRSELQRLDATTKAIKEVILDAVEKQAEKPAVQHWLKRLKTVLYDADDLFDEYATLALRKTITRGNKYSKEVQLFFSKYNQIYLAIKVSRKIKKIRSELDDIKKDGDLYQFIRRELDNGPPVIRRTRDDEHSYIPEDEVIGREDDKEAIMRLLSPPPLVSAAEFVKAITTFALFRCLNWVRFRIRYPNSVRDSYTEDDPTEVEETVSVVCLVGMGGLGKTALAQLVYNDEKVKNKFDERLWVCVSEEFDIKVIIQKILKSATNTSPDNLELDQLQSKLREVVRNKKYLLVLDDVWNENREEWLKLRCLLEDCSKGSRILVTTRSQIVADIMTDGIPPYDLKGLAAEKSWSLFEKLAFKQAQEQQNPSLVKIGKEIVEKCGNVPLAIRALASYLYGREEAAWSAVRDKEFGGIVDGQVNTTMEVLKFSYNHLWSPLKQCFAYCSVFPKDFTMEKEELVHLWIAQGFVLPSSSGQSLEDTGHDYFMQLLQRGFFQDVERDAFSGNIDSCKMHDLIHDLAQRVAGEETMCIESGSKNPDQGVRHLFLRSSNDYMSSLSSLRSLRTLLYRIEGYPRMEVSDSFFGGGLFSSLKRLRVLEIRMIEIQTVPSSVCKLLHLRYLSLVFLPIKSLPDSVQELLNLQILRVWGCHYLTELPAGVEKLTSLRHLDLFACGELTHLSADISKLTNLRHLDLRHCEKLTHVAADISTLTNLTSLGFGDCDSLDHMPSGVEKLTKLRTLRGRFSTGTGSSLAAINHLTALEDLVIESREEAYSDQLETVRWDALNRLRLLVLYEFHGMSTLPVGLQHLTTLRYLVVCICPDLIELPEWIHRLSSLEILWILDCPKLKCLPEEIRLLPRLKELQISGCPLLKGRCAADGEDWPKIQHIPKVVIDSDSDSD